MSGGPINLLLTGTPLNGVLNGVYKLIPCNRKVKLASVSVVLGVPVQTKVTLTELLELRDNLPTFNCVPLNVSSASKYLRDRLPKLAFPSAFANVFALGRMAVLNPGGDTLKLARSVGSHKSGLVEPDPSLDVWISNPFSVESRVLICVRPTLPSPPA